MPAQPAIDVALFAHNGVETVGATIESVLGQSFRPSR
jgi:hypothetical protein